ncbi:hypothetical protein Q5O14_16290 [Eubacteriaceae bacterium ES2]|nr:hypothetical protein Q5O14_16290 [Eubacteriaceae bacterium ES2]
MFQSLKDALLSVSLKTYRGFAPSGERPPYIVWDDDGTNSILSGDGKAKIQVREGTIDLFTRKDDDPLFNQIQKALNNAGITFQYKSKQDEEDTGIIHYEWVWGIPVPVEV